MAPPACPSPAEPLPSPPRRFRRPQGPRPAVSLEFGRPRSTPRFGALAACRRLFPEACQPVARGSAELKGARTALLRNSRAIAVSRSGTSCGRADLRFGAWDPGHPGTWGRRPGVDGPSIEASFRLGRTVQLGGGGLGASARRVGLCEKNVGLPAGSPRFADRASLARSPSHRLNWPPYSSRARRRSARASAEIRVEQGVRATGARALMR
jgi:hypothetical protein